jgi:hypothetical protein
MPPLAELAAPGGAFRPEAYNDWRAAALGSLAENLERQLILRFAAKSKVERFWTSVAATVHSL